jgi:hypothetical protein
MAFRPQTLQRLAFRLGNYWILRVQSYTIHGPRLGPCRVLNPFEELPEEGFLQSLKHLHLWVSVILNAISDKSEYHPASRSHFSMT